MLKDTKFFYDNKETNQREEVQLERWIWGVIYEDGKELHQFEFSNKDKSEGIFHRVGEIEQDKIKMAILFKPDEPLKRIDLPFRKGMKLIHKYKNIKPFYADHFIKVYQFGYKLGDTHHFTYVLPDDRIIISPVDDVDLALFNLK